jgi:hypothetical protein
MWWGAELTRTSAKLYFASFHKQLHASFVQTNEILAAPV